MGIWGQEAKVTAERLGDKLFDFAVALDPSGMSEAEVRNLDVELTRALIKKVEARDTHKEKQDIADAAKEAYNGHVKVYKALAEKGKEEAAQKENAKAVSALDDYRAKAKLAEITKQTFEIHVKGCEMLQEKLNAARANLESAKLTKEATGAEVELLKAQEEALKEQKGITHHRDATAAVSDALKRQTKKEETKAEALREKIAGLKAGDEADEDPEIAAIRAEALGKPAKRRIVELEEIK